MRKFDLLYKLGPYVPYAVFCGAFVIGLFPSPGERDVLIEEPGTMMTLGTSTLLMGLHMLVFCKRVVHQQQQWEGRYRSKQRVAFA